MADTFPANQELLQAETINGFAYLGTAAGVMPREGCCGPMRH